MFESNPNILSNPGSQQDGPSLAADPAGQARMLHEWVKLSPLPMALIQYPDGVILATNQLLSELLGLSEEQMLGRTPLELGLFDDPKQREKVIRGVLARSKPVSLELKIPISSGELLDIQAWIRHTRLQDKEYLLLTLANQTEAKQTEAALRISEKKFALAFRLTPDAVAISEMATGKLIEVNASFERQFGWSVSEAIGRSTSELNIWAEPNDRQRLIDSIKTKTPDGIECQGRSRDGSIRLYQLMAETFDLKGTSILVTTMRDISQQRQQEIKLRESEERLNQAMQTAKLGYWDAELDPPHFFASARGAALHGLPEEPMHGNMNQFMQNIIPADRLRIESKLRNMPAARSTNYR